MDIYLSLVCQLHHISLTLPVALSKGYVNLLPHLDFPLQLLRYFVLERSVHIFVGNIYNNTGISLRHSLHLSVLIFCTLVIIHENSAKCKWDGEIGKHGQEILSEGRKADMDYCIAFYFWNMSIAWLVMPVRSPRSQVA